MKRRIRKVAVLGSGIMGSRIACHFANIGCEVLLLDIVPRELLPEEEKKNLSLNDKIVRNRIVNTSLQQVVKAKPSPIYSSKNVKFITTGNFDDDLAKIAECDWIVEAVMERLDIKQSLFEKVEQYRKLGTLISSNTSGIPIHLMTDGRSDDFKTHFCGIHFFNPPRYLQLVEVIPTKYTDNNLVSFYADYCSNFLGKKVVVCKDTPAFIANRIGVFAIMSLFHTVDQHGLSVEEVDKLTGPVIGRPKSATFRTCDVVGLDTLVHVANGLAKLPHDEERQSFELPSFIAKMAENKWLGDKTKQGFYKKLKKEDGSSEILSLNFSDFTYQAKQKIAFPSLEQAKNIEDLKERMKFLLHAKDKAGEFYRNIFGNLFAYVSNRIPEISDELYKIDDALKAGFGWEIGPFETWDCIGLDAGIELIKALDKEIPAWLSEMQAEGNRSFYKIEAQVKNYYCKKNKAYTKIPNQEGIIDLSIIDDAKVVWKNNDARLVDIGDEIVQLSWNTKMNTIGGSVLEAVNQSIKIAEKNYKGLVISNQGANFSAGANVGMIFMMAIEQDYDDLNFAVKLFQDTMMNLRYAAIPVVVAPHNLCLGGGCEMAMHADAVVAHAELYMGLVEFGVGLIPGGGGSKEFAKRFSDELSAGDVKINKFRERFLTIGQAKVSTSAQEAFELGYLREGIDEFVMNKEHLLAKAKEKCLELANNNYTAPIRNKNVTVIGQEGLGIVYVGANSMMSGNYMSEHDQVISEKLGYVLCGGDLSENTIVSEQYLLDLERKAFVELCMQKKTLQRIESLVKTGKILRN